MPESNLPVRAAPLAPSAKSLAWAGVGVLTGLMRAGALLSGRGRRVDTIIYKADRLGDWLLAEPTIDRIVESVRAAGGEVVVWVATESNAFRQWRRPSYAVEEFDLEPSGLLAKLRRAWRISRLLATYKARRLVCLRHKQEPVRDFVLSRVLAPEIHALSSVSRQGTLAEVPHEITRHGYILAGLGLVPVSTADLLPRLAVRAHPTSARAVIAPFSSMVMKDWHDDAWCEVGAYLLGRGLQVEIWVGPGQIGRARALGGAIAERSGRTAAVRSGGIAELAEAVSDAAVVLSVDTFAAHLASAYDTPMVGLLGGGHFGDFAPWQRSSRQRWVTHPLPCFNCGWHCSRQRVECLLDVTHLTVVDKVESVLRADLAEPPSTAADQKPSIRQ